MGIIMRLAASESAAVPTRSEMLENYDAYLAEVNTSSLPFTLESSESRGVMQASITTFMEDITYQEFAGRLSDVVQWCEFIPLHLNIKACAYESHPDGTVLQFYVGPKGYTAPDEAELLVFRFTVDSTEDVLQVGFTASTGPFGSRNYDFRFRAIGAGNGVYLEFDLSSEPGFISSIAKLYLATIGSRKIGFSTVGEDNDGEPRYVKGQRGGAERNIVRYLLSIKAYFDTLDSELQADGYLKRLERWYDLTDIYRDQLYEMDRDVYTKIGQQEHKNQLILVDAILNDVEPDYDTENAKK